MPYSVKAQNCIDSSGKPGKYVVFKTDERKTASCHGNRADALAAARIRIQNSDDLTSDQKKRMLENL